MGKSRNRGGSSGGGGGRGSGGSYHGSGVRAVHWSSSSSSGAKPWHRSTLFVSLVSLLGALMAITVSHLVSDQTNWLLRRYTGDFGYGGYGGRGGNFFSERMSDAAAMEEERDVYAAAEAFAQGNIEYQNGVLHYHTAHEKYLEAVQLAPGHSFAWANLGNVQRDLGDLEQSVASHRRAATLLPTRARHWFNLGVSLYSSRRHLAEAVESFRHALHLNDAFASAHYSLAVALVEAGKRADAHGHYEKAIAIEPHTMVSAAAT